jgi:hypothetical protein
VSRVEENSGLGLQLQWRQEAAKDWQLGPEWFDNNKLEAVGYDLSVPLSEPTGEQYYARALPRQAYVVLEYEGQAWQRWLADTNRKLGALREQLNRQETTREIVKEAEGHHERLRRYDSRLIAVDVGTEPARLRQQYSDRTRFVVTPAEVRLIFVKGWTDKAGTRHPSHLSGRISQILVDVIEVPRDKRAVLDKLGQIQSPHEPRYSVILKYGKRYEPWIVEVQPLSTSN